MVKVRSFNFLAGLLAGVAIGMLLVIPTQFKKNAELLKAEETAGILGDICHIAQDNIGNDFDEIYYDVLDDLDAWNITHATKEDVEHASWAY